MKYHLAEILDIEELEKLCQSFSDLTGITTGIMDLEDKVHIVTNIQEVCAEFHRVNEKTNKFCMESDMILSKQLQEGNPYSIYKCKNGLVDVAMPILVKDTLVGNLFIGQFLFEDPDMDFFRKQAIKYGFDQQKYLAAVKKVPVFTEEYIETLLHFLVQLAKTIGGIGVKNLDYLENKKTLEIKEKKLVEARNKEKEYEKRMSSIFRAAPTGIGVVRNRIISEVNPRLCKIIGYSQDELIGLSARILYPTDEDFKFVGDEKYWQIMEKGTGTVETRWKRKDGSIINVLLSSTPINIENLSEGVTFTVLDITQAKNTEKDLRISQRNSSAWIENSPVCTKIIDLDYNLRFMSKSGAIMLNIKDAAELYGKPYPFDFFPESSNRIMKNTLQKVKETGQTITVETFATDSEGNELWNQSTIVPVNDEAGKLDYFLIVSLDTTNRKKAEISLRDNEEKYRMLAEAISDGIITMDLEGKITYSNLGVEKITGYSQTSLFNRHYEELIAPEHRKTAEEHRKAELESGKLPLYEIEIVKLTGEKVPVEINTSNILDSKGVVVGRLAVFRDISSRILREKKLRESEEKLRLIIDNSPLGICTSDFQGNYLSSNAAYEKIVGYNKEELQEISYFDITHPDYLGNDKKLLQKVINNEKELHPFKKKYIRKDKKQIDVRINPNIIRDANGNPMSLIGIIEDITSSELLLRRNKMLSEAIESSPVSIVITNKEGVIEYVNPFFIELTGYSQEEAIGNNPRILKSGQQPDSFYKEMWDTLTKGKRWSGEFHNKKKNGEYFWENASISPICNSEGEIVQYVAIKEDITEKKSKLTELKIAKEKAQESDRLKTAFLNNMSHEIRTPLNGMLGFMDFILDPGYSNEDKKEFVQIVKKSSDRLVNTVSDIIDISKIEAGQVDVVNDTVCVNEIQNELLRLFTIEANNKGLSLQFVPTLANKEAEIITDNHKLYGILSNLIKNAIKFTAAGTVTFGYSLKQNMLEFYVKDTGIGVPINRQQAIFNRFEQADITDTRAYEGSGLGLPIAQSYVEMLGGTMWMTSTEGVGSEFKFTIPYKSTIPDSTHGEQTDGNTTKKGINQYKVLVAEDEEVNKQYFELIFKNKFHEIIFVETGQQAVDGCHKNPDIDLILMDLKMPGMSGFTAVEEIRKFNSDVIIIAHTAYATVRDKKQAIEAGCDDFITKPINNDLLFSMIDIYANKK